MEQDIKFTESLTEMVFASTLLVDLISHTQINTQKTRGLTNTFKYNLTTPVRCIQQQTVLH